MVFARSGSAKDKVVHLQIISIYTLILKCIFFENLNILKLCTYFIFTRSKKKKIKNK